MHFEFDLVQGMVDDLPEKSKMSKLEESESDALLMNYLCDTSLQDQLSECAIDDSMPDLDVFVQATYPSPNRDEMEGEADRDSGLDMLLSPGAGEDLDLPSPGPSYDLSDVALGSPCSQASSDNLMQELQQSVGFPNLLDSEFAPGDAFLQDLVDNDIEQAGIPGPNQVDGSVAESRNHTNLVLESCQDENDNEIEQILAAASIKVEDTDNILAPTPLRVLRSNTKPKTRNTDSLLKTIDVSQLAVTKGVVRGPVARTIKIVRTAPRATPSPMPVIETAGDRNNRNAVQARINRQKKKAYIEGLEEQVGGLGSENNKLKADSQKLKRERDVLQQEVTYLKRVLANQSMLSGMLQNIGQVEDVRLTSSFVNSRKRSASELDHDYGQPGKKGKVAVGGGVCLHVDKNNVSLEFCSGCSRMAKGACRDDV